MAPPTLTDLNPDEVRAYTLLVGRAANDLSSLEGYAGSTCTETDGLNGVLSVFREPVQLVAEANETVLRRANDKLWDTKHNISDSVDAALAEDAGLASHVANAFPEAPQFFPEYTGGGTEHGYEDAENPDPQQPTRSVDEITADGFDPGGVIGILDEAWELVTDDSLIATIIEPLVGKPGRLKWLSEAYEELSTASYQVGWNLRSGTMNVAPHWNGDSGRAFEMHMFRWHMGLGGLGDAQHVVSEVLDQAYRAINAAIQVVVNLIIALLESLAAKIARRSIPIIGVILALGDLYNAIRHAVDAIDTIITKIDELRDLIDDFIADLNAAKDAIEILVDGVSGGEVTGTVQELVDYGQELTYNIEEDHDWDPQLGAARAVLLPL